MRRTFVAAAVMVTVGMGSAYADEVLHELRRQSPQEALNEDATLGGYDPSGMAEALAVNDIVGSLQNVLEDQFPARLAGVWLGEPGQPTTFRFVGEPPAAAQNLIDSTGIDAVIDTSATVSLRQLKDIKAAAETALLNADITTIGTGIDEISGKVRVYAGPATVPQVEALLLAAQPTVARKLYAIEVSDEPMAGLTHNRGGGFLQDDGTFECTAGWSVESTKGLGDGIAYAGHCLGINQYREPYGRTYGSNYQRQWIGSNGDSEWAKTSHASPAEFYPGPGDYYRDVTSVEPANGFSINEPMCQFGRKTNERFCDQKVYDRYYSGTFYVIDCDCSYHIGNLVMATKKHSDFGDSGGGWSYSNRAYGIMTGFANGRDVLTRAGSAPYYFETRVKTQ